VVGGGHATAPTITAAEAGALTSCSQLVELALCDPRAQLQPQAYASLFPPGRQLQHLTKLVASADLLSTPAAVRQAGSCCPNLRSLMLGSSRASYKTRWEAGEAATVADSLSALSTLGSLHLLRLNQVWPRMPAPLWQALGTLSQRTTLEVYRPYGASETPMNFVANDVLHLTGCKALRSLSFQGKHGTVLRVQSKVRMSSAQLYLHTDRAAWLCARSVVWLQRGRFCAVRMSAATCRLGEVPLRLPMFGPSCLGSSSRMTGLQRHRLRWMLLL
jgi:hypothetical protein